MSFQELPKRVKIESQDLVMNHGEFNLRNKFHNSNAVKKGEFIVDATRMTGMSVCKLSRQFSFVTCTLQGLERERESMDGERNV